jgi:hypothetical protein
MRNGRLQLNLSSWKFQRPPKTVKVNNFPRSQFETLGASTSSDSEDSEL